MSVLVDMTQKARKTGGDLRLHEIMLQKLTFMATHPNREELDEDHQTDMFAAIGRASINVLLLKDLYNHQKRCITAIKRNEFFVFPLVILVKIINLITGKKS